MGGEEGKLQIEVEISNLLVVEPLSTKLAFVDVAPPFFAQMVSMIFIPLKAS